MTLSSEGSDVDSSLDSSEDSEIEIISPLPPPEQFIYCQEPLTSEMQEQIRQDLCESVNYHGRRPLMDAINLDMFGSNGLARYDPKDALAQNLYCSGAAQRPHDTASPQLRASWHSHKAFGIPGLMRQSSSGQDALTATCLSFCGLVHGISCGEHFSSLSNRRVFCHPTMSSLVPRLTR